MAGESALHPGLAVAIRFALRELRGGLGGFGIFIACIVLGVATIAGVGSVARGMTDGIAREGRAILGGDFALSLVQRQANPDERSYLERAGALSEVATLRAMARKADGESAALVELKSIDASYPLAGAVKVVGGGSAAKLLAPSGGTFGGLAEPELLVRLGVSVGDAVRLGGATVRLTGVIDSEPDRLAGGFSFGPRLMISREALVATGLIQPGSLVTWHYRVRLAGEPPDPAVKAAADSAMAAFPKAGWQLRMRDDAAPGLRRNIERFAEFLTLIGLAALIVGGVGVANAVASYLEGKRDVIATLKCLGAPAGFTVAVYLVQILILAALGIVIGLSIGAVIPFLAGAALHTVLPVTISGVYPFELILAAVYGLATALAFALFPLGRAREVSPTALFRDQVVPARAWPRPAFLIAAAAAILLLAALAIGLAFDRRIAVVFVIAAAAAFLLLRLVALFIMALARRAPSVRSTELRLALANVHRPGALTPSVVLSLGLGLALVVTLVLIDGNFRRELLGSIPKNAPSFFFLDVRQADRPAFEAFVRKEAPNATLDFVPMLRGRIVSLKGVAADKVEADANTRWVLDGDRGITYAADQPEKSRLTEGAWWPAAYDGPPLVSFESDVGRGLHLKVGDQIIVNVLGREITATIANFREVEWQTLAINFVMVFSPNTFRGAPFANLSTLVFPDGGNADEELAFLKKVTAAFPALTAVRVKEALQTANDIVNRIGWGVRAASAVTLLASVLVLGGAFAAGRRQRIRDAVILKTLGATRLRLITAFSLEFLMIGGATAVFGLLAGSVAAWFILSNVMEIGFHFLAGPALGAALAALLLTLGFGLAGTFRALGQKAAPVLRNL
jgi:putative ABC transport system permease protein